MTRFELFNMVEKIYGFFRLEKSPKASVVDEWLVDLNYIDEKAIPYILKNLKDLDTLPRNLVKIIKGIYSQWKRENTGTAYVKYNEIEDSRYPVSKLYDAQEVYIKSGRGAFLHFCKVNYMPQTDIERVENKVNHMIDVGKVKGFIENVGEDFSGMFGE